MLKQNKFTMATMFVVPDRRSPLQKVHDELKQYFINEKMDKFLRGKKPEKKKRPTVMQHYRYRKKELFKQDFDRLYRKSVFKKLMRKSKEVKKHKKRVKVFDSKLRKYDSDLDRFYSLMKSLEAKFDKEKDLKKNKGMSEKEFMKKFKIRHKRTKKLLAKENRRLVKLEKVLKKEGSRLTKNGEQVMEKVYTQVEKAREEYAKEKLDKEMKK